MAVFLQRSTDIYISTTTAGSANATNTVKLNVKDFSFNRSANIVNVGRETIDPSQVRVVKPHVQNVSPVSFNLTTYVTPLLDTNVVSPDEYLWLSLVGDSTGLSYTANNYTANFSSGNVATLPNLTIWFDNPDNTEGNYRIDNVIVDLATINFDINGIAEVQWSGRGLALVEDNVPPAFTDRTNQTNYIKNRLTTISLASNGVNYTLALTGGRINIDNKVQFYGRSQIGKTTVPVGHYTGNREVTGELDFYLKTGTNTSVDLFRTINANIDEDLYESTYLSDITINVGGTPAGTTPQDINTIANFFDANDGSNLSATVPGGIQSGDLLLAVVIANNDSVTITSQDGFTQIYYNPTWPGTGDSSYGVYAKIATGTESGTFDWTCTTTRCSLVGQVLRGADTSGAVADAFDVDPSIDNQSNSTGSSQTADSIDTVSDKARAFATFMSDTATTASYGSYTNGYGDEVEAPSNVGQPLTMVSKVIPTAGATGTVNATLTGDSPQWVAQHFAIKPSTVATGQPYLTINIPQSLLNIPRIDTREVFKISIPFVAQEEAGNYISVVHNL